MISREQAEQALHDYTESLNKTYEIRSPRLEMMINTSDIGSSDELPMLEDNVMAPLEEEGWLCSYERKYKATWGTWQWNRAKCYIVEPKPEPFVIE